MTAFATVINRLTALGILIALGYFLTKRKIMPEAFPKVLVDFIVKVIIPLFAIVALQVEFSKEMLVNGGLVFVTTLIVFSIGGIVGFLTSKLFKIHKLRKGMWIYTSMMSNSIFMGFPVLQAVFGNDVLFYLTILNLACNIVQFTLGIYIVSYYGGEKANIDIKKLLITPLNISIIIGIFLFISQIKLPTAIMTAGEMITSTMTPLALVYIGTMLSQNSLKEIVGDKDVYLLSVIRLIIMPVLAYFILNAFITDTMVLGSVVIATGAMPAPAMGALFVGQYGGDTKFASKLVFLSTFLCGITVPIVCLLFI